LPVAIAQILRPNVEALVKVDQRQVRVVAGGDAAFAGQFKAARHVG
jgi:hypothetical protein